MAARTPGVHSVEFDVRRSADGHLVVTHGPEAGPNIAQASLEELRKSGVPLLSEVLDCCLEGKLVMNVELKGGESAENVQDTIALIREKDALSMCRISSFDRGMLQRTMELEPRLPLGALYHPAERMLDPSDPSKGVIYKEAPEDFASWFADHKVAGDSVNLRAEAVLRKPLLIDEARRCGKQVMVWLPCQTNAGFEDGEATYQRILDLGVDVICCNKPSVLTAMLRQDQEEDDVEDDEDIDSSEFGNADTVEGKDEPAAKKAKVG